MEWAEDYLSLMSGEAPGGIGYLVVDVGGEDAAALQACRAPEITGHRRLSACCRATDSSISVRTDSL